MSEVKLIAMDMDGTLTQHKSLLEDMNRKELERLEQKYTLVIVGAGSCDRILNQMPKIQADIIGNYGMQMSFYDKEAALHKLVLSEKQDVNKEEILEKMSFLRDKHGFKDFAGESVEFHECGMVTLPLLGTKADLKSKLEFDPDRKKRRKFYDEVVNLFSDYTVFIGGTSSFDMTPSPYNKYYALCKYAEIKGFTPNEIIYFGDDYGIGGNDYQVFNSEIAFRKIDNYKDFYKSTCDL